MTIEFESLSFEENTDPEVIRFTHLNNGQKWKGCLSIDGYATREQVLGNSQIANKDKDAAIQKLYPEWSRYLGLKYFVTKDLSLPDSGNKTDQIVSSCETLNRIGYCINKNSGGKIEPALIVCIGGVYTLDHHRRKGYAKQMILQLNQYYDKIRSEPNAPLALKNMIINLYSEVGEYYSNMEYDSFHVPLHEMSQLDEISARYCGGPAKMNGTYLSYDNYGDLIKLHADRYSESLYSLHSKNPDAFVFTVAADLDIYKWFEDRDIYIKNKSGKGAKGDLTFGFRFDNDESHIIWHHNWNENALIIVTAFIDKSCEFKEKRLGDLLAHAILEAKRHSMNIVEFWDNEIPLEKEFPRLHNLLKEVEPANHLFVENGSMSALRAPLGYKSNEVIWDNNTKFCWF